MSESTFPDVAVHLPQVPQDLGQIATTSGWEQASLESSAKAEQDASFMLLHVWLCSNSCSFVTFTVAETERKKETFYPVANGMFL